MTRRKTDSRRPERLINLLAAMVRRGVDWKQTMRILDCTRMPAVTTLYAFLDTGNAHISSWRRDGNKQWRPVVRFGAGQDAPHPGEQRVRRRRKIPARVVAVISMVRAMEADSWHGAGLAAHLGMGPNTVRRMMEAMAEKNLTFIEDWRSRSTGPKTPMWAWGPGRASVPKPELRCLKDIARSRYHRAKNADIFRRAAAA